MSEYAAEIATAKVLGNLVAHSTRTVFLAPYYGRPLMYYGELSGRDWPHTYDISAELLFGVEPLTSAQPLAQG